MFWESFIRFLSLNNFCISLNFNIHFLVNILALEALTISRVLNGWRRRTIFCLSSISTTILTFQVKSLCWGKIEKKTYRVRSNLGYTYENAGLWNVIFKRKSRIPQTNEPVGLSKCSLIRNKWEINHTRFFYDWPIKLHELRCHCKDCRKKPPLHVDWNIVNILTM